MTPGFLIRFTLMADYDNGGAELIQMLGTALCGERPIQNRTPGTWASYIEGSVQWYHKTVRVRLWRADIDNHEINVRWREDFPATHVAEIAQIAADAFWDSIATSASREVES